MNKILQFLSNSKQKDIELIMNPRFACTKEFFDKYVI